MATPRIAITTGEPAGIGPDITLFAAKQPWDAELVAIGDLQLLTERAQQLDIAIDLQPFEPMAARTPHTPGELKVLSVPCGAPVEAGKLDPANASYVVATLHEAVAGCLSGTFDAVTTAPVQKSIINEAQIPFSGHTEFLAHNTGTNRVVMMLATDTLRVALATTHLPLKDVSQAITEAGLKEVLRILHDDLTSKFGIERPRIAVLGLNPHAGEGGHLGREEIDTIIPALETLRAEGFQLEGPLPADTAFNPDIRRRCDAYLAMYHDQGLPVLKYAGFGNAINITLGLPILRTSVDHGTALDLAATGRAKSGSLCQAIKIACELAQKSAN